MKTCPICGAGAFDDAEVCYGCLYRFQNEDQRHETVPPIGAQQHMVAVQDKSLKRRVKPEKLEVEETPNEKEVLYAKNCMQQNENSDNSFCDTFREKAECDKAELTMHFEFSGFAPVVCDEQKGNKNMAVQFFPQMRNCELLQKNIESDAEGLCDIIVQFRLKNHRLSEWQESGRSVRGSHVRAVAMRTDMPVS